MVPKTLQTDEVSTRVSELNIFANSSHFVIFKLPLSNKFGMLDVDDHDETNENDDAQSPSIDD
jgi:hypothetical protein